MTLNETKPNGSALKRAAVLAEEIEAEILDLGWPVGHLLGSELELIERHGVSRAVLREAIRLLEHHQVAEMRRGRGGGLFVTRPDPAVVANVVALFLRYRGVSEHDLFEVRQTLEMTSVSLAATRATEEDVRRLHELATSSTAASSTELASQGAGFHSAIGEVSRNPAIHLFVQVLTILTEALVDHSPAQPETEGVRQAHTAIAEAIEAANPALAQRRMLRHFEAMERAGFQVEAAPVPPAKLAKKRGS